MIAAGPGATDANGKIVPVSVQAGDKVLLPSFGGSPVKVGDEEYLLYSDREILAKIEYHVYYRENRQLEIRRVRPYCVD